jgi:hypothetical protein
MSPLVFRTVNHAVQRKSIDPDPRVIDRDVLVDRRLASLLGMTPKNLSRAFKGLRAYGVSVSGNRIAIGNRADLERFAKPSLLIDDHTT